MGTQGDQRMKNVFIELEYWIEELLGKKRITTKKMKMYKGTTKKWQVLDDAAFSRDQVEKIQAATNAPSPKQLEEWKEKHDIPLNLPATNATVSKWRDEPIPTESADFDPEALIASREQKREQYLERFEVPKQITEAKEF